jgi:hypothetical protein
VPKTKLPYTEFTMAAAVARQKFDDAVCVLDNCNWPGNECDLLVVKKNLRVVDVEIKISRADFKADQKKSKWWAADWVEGMPSWNQPKRRPVIRVHPKNVWQHYIAVPQEIFTPDLLEFASPASGIITVRAHGGKPYNWPCTLLRRAKPQKGIEPLTAEQVVQIARLAGFRMWAAYDAAGWTALDTVAPV